VYFPLKDTITLLHISLPCSVFLHNIKGFFQSRCPFSSSCFSEFTRIGVRLIVKKGWAPPSAHAGSPGSHMQMRKPNGNLIALDETKAVFLRNDFHFLRGGPVVWARAEPKGGARHMHTFRPTLSRVSYLIEYIYDNNWTLTMCYYACW
jgi:hypothetical protein